MVDVLIASGIIIAAAVWFFWVGKTKKLKPVTKEHILLFLAGAEAFHALLHAFFGITKQTFVVPWLVVTQPWNIGSAIVNGFIAIGLVYWALRYKK